MAQARQTLRLKPTTLTCPKKARRAKGHVLTDHDIEMDKAHAKAYAKAYRVENKVYLAAKSKASRKQKAHAEFVLRQHEHAERIRERVRERERQLLLQAQKEARQRQFNEARVLLREATQRKQELLAQVELENEEIRRTTEIAFQLYREFQ